MLLLLEIGQSKDVVGDVEVGGQRGVECHHLCLMLNSEPMPVCCYQYPPGTHTKCANYAASEAGLFLLPGRR